jgi:hypothetical protein
MTDLERWIDDPSTPEELRDDLRAAASAPPPQLDYDAVLRMLVASIAGSGPTGAPDAPAGTPAPGPPSSAAGPVGSAASSHAAGASTAGASTAGASTAGASTAGASTAGASTAGAPALGAVGVLAGVALLAVVATRSADPPSAGTAPPEARPAESAAAATDREVPERVPAHGATASDPPPGREAPPGSAIEPNIASPEHAAAPESSSARPAPRAASTGSAPRVAPAAVDHGPRRDGRDGLLHTEVLRELSLVREASAAVAREPARALALTERHRREFPRGSMIEEREAIRIRALAALGRADEAEREAERFLRAHPFSPHAEQVRRALAR